MAQLQNGQVVPISQVDKQTGGVLLNGELVPVVGYVGGKMPAQAKPTAQPQIPTAQFPEFDPRMWLTAPQGAAPKLNKQQQRRFDDIKRDQPQATDERILNYMRQKGWL